MVPLMPRQHGPTHASTSDFWPTDYEAILKPPSLWWFVPTALGTDTHVGRLLCITCHNCNHYLVYHCLYSTLEWKLCEGHRSCLCGCLLYCLVLRRCLAEICAQYTHNKLMNGIAGGNTDQALRTINKNTYNYPLLVAVFVCLLSLLKASFKPNPSQEYN